MQLLSVFAVLSVALTALAAPILERRQDKPRETIDPNLWKTLQRYAKFSSASAFKECPSPPYNSAFVSYFDNSETDTQAGIYRADDAKEIVLSFLGTTNDADLITDLTFIPVPWDARGVDCPGCTIHLGFLKAWKSVQDNVLDTIKDLVEEYPEYQLIVAGHSLGAALAGLAYGSLAPEYNNIKAYTTGGPRFGNDKAADYIDKLSGASDANIGNYIRVTSSNDLVPQLAPEFLGFQHPRTEVWLEPKSAEEQGPENTYRCFGREADDCNKGQIPHSLLSHGNYGSLVNDTGICGV